MLMDAQGQGPRDKSISLLYRCIYLIPWCTTSDLKSWDLICSSSTKLRERRKSCSEELKMKTNIHLWGWWENRWHLVSSSGFALCVLFVIRTRRISSTVGVEDDKNLWVETTISTSSELLPQIFENVHWWTPSFLTPGCFSCLRQSWGERGVPIIRWRGHADKALRQQVDEEVSDETTFMMRTERCKAES